MNVNNEFKKCKEILNNLTKLRRDLSKKGNNSLQYDLGLLIEQYSLFCLVCERLLHSMSILRRDRNGPHWARKYHQKYSKREKKIAEKAKIAEKYYRLDENDFFIHARILLDRYAKLSKYFFINGDVPSSHSFRQHKDFFKNDDLYKRIIKHKIYADYIRNNTEWFDMCLKEIRDQKIVHINSKFLRGSGISNSGEFIIYIIPIQENQDEFIHVNICDLIRAIREFSKFFINYMKKSI